VIGLEGRELPNMFVDGCHQSAAQAAKHWLCPEEKIAIRLRAAPD
tara:strand:+ start:513 stop:647 length:135 start_codon:yes stop_codon:yes gene_type:complete